MSEEIQAQIDHRRAIAQIPSIGKEYGAPVVYDAVGALDRKAPQELVALSPQEPSSSSDASNISVDTTPYIATALILVALAFYFSDA